MFLNLFKDHYHISTLLNWYRSKKQLQYDERNQTPVQNPALTTDKHTSFYLKTPASIQTFHEDMRCFRRVRSTSLTLTIWQLAVNGVIPLSFNLTRSQKGHDVPRCTSRQYTAVCTWKRGRERERDESGTSSAFQGLHFKLKLGITLVLVASDLWIFCRWKLSLISWNLTNSRPKRCLATSSPCSAFPNFGG